jgi:two-component system alkaline phosphatase synthesis response regulator PhoP
VEVKGKKVLVVDDEPDITEIISYNLAKEGYEVFSATNGIDAIDKAISLKPDLLILDIMMPRMNGIEVCKTLRGKPEFDDTLIILLTALSDETSHIKGLEIGADDYLTKPISPKVLVSRANAIFRRLNKDEAKSIELGRMTIDPEKFIVTLEGKDIVLAKKEFELLFLLASKPGKVFLRNEILNRVWGTEVIVGDRTIDVHIRKIRAKLGIDCLTTVKGVGYKFEM